MTYSRIVLSMIFLSSNTLTVGCNMANNSRILLSTKSLIIEPGIGIAGFCELGMSADKIFRLDDCAYRIQNGGGVCLPNFGVFAYFGSQNATRDMRCVALSFIVEKDEKYSDMKDLKIFEGHISSFCQKDMVTWRKIIDVYGPYERELVNNDYYDYSYPCLWLVGLPTSPTKMLIYPDLGVRFEGKLESKGPNEIFIFRALKLKCIKKSKNKETCFSVERVEANK